MFCWLTGCFLLGLITSDWGEVQGSRVLTFPISQIWNNREIGLKTPENFCSLSPCSKEKMISSYFFLSRYLFNWAEAVNLKRRASRSRSALNQTANVDGCVCMWCFGKMGQEKPMGPQRDSWGEFRDWTLVLALLLSVVRGYLRCRSSWKDLCWPKS